jgi:sulfate adenylyltransferase
MKVLTYENMVYTEEHGFMEESKAAAAKVKTKNLSGTKFRAMLRAGDEIPSWFSFPSVISALRKSSN